jgi:hypothetical protein
MATAGRRRTRDRLCAVLPARPRLPDRHHPLGCGPAVGERRPSHHAPVRRRRVEANLAMVGVVRSAAEEQQATPAQVALAWLRYRAEALGVAEVPIPGTRRASRSWDGKSKSHIERTVRTLYPPGASPG